MNLTIIKEEIKRNQGKKIKIVHSGSRNKIEVYEGYIYAVYPQIFSIMTNSNNYVQTRSFSYNDILSKTIEIFV